MEFPSNALHGLMEFVNKEYLKWQGRYIMRFVISRRNDANIVKS